MQDESSQPASDAPKASTWALKGRLWALRLKQLALSHAKQIASAAFVAVCATVISTYVLTQMGIEDDDPLAQVVAGTAQDNQAVQQVYVTRAKLSQVMALMTMPKMQIAQQYQMTGKLPASDADLDLSMFDLAEHALVDSVRFTPDGKLKVALADDFGADKHMVLWPSASTNGAFIAWRCETNLREKYLGAAGMRPCEPAN